MASTATLSREITRRMTSHTGVIDVDEVSIAESPRMALRAHLDQPYRHRIQ